eukprot:Rmarinus@m.21910
MLMMLSATWTVVHGAGCAFVSRKLVADLVVVLLAVALRPLILATTVASVAIGLMSAERVTGPTVATAVADPAMCRRTAVTVGTAVTVVVAAVAAAVAGATIDPRAAGASREAVAALLASPDPRAGAAPVLRVVAAARGAHLALPAATTAARPGALPETASQAAAQHLHAAGRDLLRGHPPAPLRSAAGAEADLK